MSTREVKPINNPSHDLFQSFLVRLPENEIYCSYVLYVLVRVESGSI